MTRANRVRDCVKLQERVDKIAAGAAMMTETTYDRVFIDGTSEVLPNYTLEQALYRNFTEIGVPTHTDAERAFAEDLRKTYPAETTPPGIGAMFDDAIADSVREQTQDMTAPLNDFLLPPYSGTGFVAGSTDLGDVSWLTPTAQIEVVAWPAGCPGHTWQVVSCGKSTLAHKGMLCAGKVLAGAAIDLLTDSELLQAAREEFRKKSASGYVCPIEAGAVPIAL
jgi:aminobenzoyl-glutamate utilization protein B